MKGMERIEESLCEKSMKVVSNVIKLSALTIAKRSLGQTVIGNGQVTSKTLNQISPTPSTVNIVPSKPMLRAQKPQTNTNQTYLVKPECVNNNSSSFVVKEDMNVDGRASDFIKKVREKNQIKDVFVGSENPPDELLPPRVVK